MIRAFGRSRPLTKGGRWKIFGLFVLLLVLIWIFYAVFGAIILAGGMLGSLRTAGGFTPSPTYLALSGITSTLTLAFWGTTQASLYIALRNWKDGPQGSNLADLFA